MTEKQERMFEAIFRMNEIETIAQLQQESGVQLEPTNAYVPDDELAAKIHFELEDKLPKEIRFEKMLQLVKDCIQFERVTNRKTLYDLITLNCADIKIKDVQDGRVKYKGEEGTSYRDWETDRKSTRLNSSHEIPSRMPSSA